MPGFNLIVNYDESVHAQERSKYILQGLEQLPEQRTGGWLETDDAAVTATLYDHYPVEFWEDADFRYFFEGYLYGEAHRNTREKLRDVAADAFSAHRQGLESFLRSTDGEFILLLQDKSSGEWRLLNDLFGRLPVYLVPTERGIVATRNIAFALGYLGDPRVDPVALAEYFMFGSSLGVKTPWKGVQYLPLATMLSIDAAGQWGLESLHELDVSKKSDARSIKDVVEELVFEFRQACKNRAAVAQNAVVALSGGFDSRAVAGGLAAERVPFRAITMSRPGWYPKSETAVARETAGLLKREWREFGVPPVDGRLYAQLLRMKCGLNELGMSFHLPFFREIQATYGAGAVYFTGDGGDKTLPDLRPLAKLRSDDAVAQYAVDRRGIFGLTEAAAMAGISAERLQVSLRDQVASYPGKTGVDKYVHFLLYERSFRWLFEGEDRNREFFWTTTPFYSVPFFLKSMACPDRFKRGYKLYRRFLQTLCPMLADLEKAGGEGRPGTLKFQAKHLSKLVLHATPRFSRRMQHWVRGANGFAKDSEIVRLLRHQLNSCPRIGEAIDLAAVRRVLEHSDQHSKGRLTNLVTVTSMLESFNGGSSLDTWDGDLP